MSGGVALVGGDEFRAGCESMDMSILRISGRSKPSVLIIPAAAAYQNPSLAASNGVGYFLGLGAEPSALMVLDALKASDSDFLLPMDSADILYFTGGNPQHLRHVLTGSLMFEKVKSAIERGAIIVGSSAGAMVLGSWMKIGQWTEGLGILDGLAVLPHHENSDPALVSEQIEMAEIPRDLSVVGIDAMTCCFGGRGGWSVMGRGLITLYESGSWYRFGSGDEVHSLPLV